ncbi:MAG: hypothetical protein ABSB42_13380 [Tepidisphaeraceae bacterium]|jgi:hypothetical protein
MTREELYAIWAPPGGVWTPWAEAVVFAYGSLEDSAPLPAHEPDVPWFKDSGSTAIVVDLPGAAGVDMGIALARLGYRPVPLYNAVPGVMEFVDVGSIQRALSDRAATLASLKLPYEARPAFMLDTSRRGAGIVGEPGQFDNRSMCFPTDFPSAAFLAQYGIATVLLMAQADRNPQADMSHTLLRWQQAGIKIFSLALDDKEPPRLIDVHPPSRFRALWYGWLATIGLKRNPLGGFGGRIPFPGQGGWGMAG